MDEDLVDQVERTGGWANIRGAGKLKALWRGGQGQILQEAEPFEAPSHGRAG